MKRLRRSLCRWGSTGDNRGDEVNVVFLNSVFLSAGVRGEKKIRKNQAAKDRATTPLIDGVIVETFPCAR